MYYRVLSDHEILTEEHFCRDLTRSGIDFKKTSRIGQTAGECRKQTPGYEFYTKEEDDSVTYRVLLDHEIIVEENVYISKAKVSQSNPPVFFAMPSVFGDSHCVGLTARVCRMRYPDIEFYAKENNFVFDKFNFLGEP